MLTWFTFRHAGYLFGLQYCVATCRTNHCVWLHEKQRSKN